VPQFVKSHGLGNDYLVVDPAALPFELDAGSVRLICDRHAGVGSDGILALDSEPDGADFGVRIYNPDGSEAEKSGNGIRILAKYLREHGRTDRDAFTIRTAGGTVRVRLETEGERVSVVTADMGRATFGSVDAIDVVGRRLRVTTLSLGNPHCVVFVDDLAATDVMRLGPLIERHAAFPDRTNVQFAHVRSRREIQIRIWERGAGHTLASGTSSCAVAAAAQRLGLVDRDVVVTMPGGSLEVRLARDGEIELRGPVEEVCSGDFSPDLVRRLVRRGPR
jgi:diaminopimelate epimerase